MYYEELRPSEPLARYVKCYWALQVDDSSGGNEPETVLPDGSLEIVFNLADRFRRFHADGTIERQPRAIAVGQMRRFVKIQPTGKVDLFGVRFQTAGAYHFFKCSLNGLTDKIVELDAILENRCPDLEARIYSAGSTHARAAIVEGLLLSSLRYPRPNERVVEAVKQHISVNSGVVSIRQISKDLGVSQRQLERHFLELVGVSPKFYSRIIRLQSILYLGRSRMPGDMLALALDHGYYDQSHFVREFTEFAGKSPTAFLRDENRMAEAFIGS